MRGRLPVKGSFTSAGTPAAVSVNLSFRPVMVIIYNETDGTNFAIKVDGSDDDKALTVADTGSGTTDLAFASSNALTITSRGFQVSAGFQGSSKLYRYVAF